MPGLAQCPCHRLPVGLLYAVLTSPAAGFLRGAYVGASDSCKYAETLAIEVANRTIHDPKQRQQVGGCSSQTCGAPSRWCSPFRTRSI